jgi:hypothetical protein
VASAQNYDDDPTAWEARRAAAAAARHGNNGIGEVLGIVAQGLLPTPRSTDGPKGAAGVHVNSQKRLEDGKATLPEAVALMPTPIARDYKDGPEQPNVPINGYLGRAVWETPTVAEVTNWGKYEAAIRRTEAVTGTHAPSPTLPDGRHGKRRLAATFVEWMMLLPAGTVTGRGLTRTQELARLGNGVVPAQAATAISMLLARMVRT